MILDDDYYYAGAGLLDYRYIEKQEARRRESYADVDVDVDADADDEGGKSSREERSPSSYIYSRPSNPPPFSCPIPDGSPRRAPDKLLLLLRVDFVLIRARLG